jgi:formate dehydrogenase major subunit
MTKNITITIDGTKYITTPDKTVLTICKENNIFIPTFCHDERFEAEASCRMCLVEVDGNKDKLTTSCTLYPTDGMIIETKNEEVLDARQEILKLMWSCHPNDCVVCDANARCSLQDYMYFYDVPSEKAYNRKERNYKIDDSNKFFYIDQSKCILCYKCVNVCDQLVGVGALQVNERGAETYISFAYDKGMDYSACVSCGNCVSVCPTGAIVEKSKTKYKNADTRKVQTTCSYCGVGCQMDLILENDKVVRIDPVNVIPNEGLLCVKGKFAFNYINHPNRLKTPLIKRNGVFEEASWEEAYTVIVNKINETKKAFGSNAFAGLASAKCTNEENYLFQKFIRAVLGTNNVDHCARLCHASTVSGLATTLGSGAMTNSIGEVKDHDVIFIIGSNTSETHPVIANFMRQAVKKGAKMIVAEPRKIELAKEAEIFVQIMPGTNVALLNGMMNVIYNEKLYDKEFISSRTEGFDEMIEVLQKYPPEVSAEICSCAKEDIINAARLYASGKKAGIYYAMGITQHSNGTNHVKSIANLAMMCGNVGKESTGINPLRGQNNVQGACDAGSLPNVYPGYQKIHIPEINEKFEKAWGVPLSDKVGLSIPHIVNGAYNNLIKFLYIMGENPIVSDPDINHVKDAFGKIDFLVVQDIFMTETAEFADVVLPASSFAEKDGTFTNTERRVQMVNKAIEPIGNSKPDWVIIQELMNLLGYEQNTKNPKEIMDELASVTPIYQGIDYSRISETGLQWPVKDKNHPGTKFLHQDKFSRGLGLFTPVDYFGAKELPDEEYPLTLTTGRVLYHFHTRTMTGKNDEINELVPVNFIEINQRTADKYGLSDMQEVIVKSRRGETMAATHITDTIGDYVVFMPFHFADGANILTNNELDPTCDIPELKVASCEIVAKF